MITLFTYVTICIYSDFKCEDEGFYPHPRDCKKYFWCLSSGPSELGIVAHQFTCPSGITYYNHYLQIEKHYFLLGLYFNKAADSCDYTQNVLCNKKAKTTTAPTTTTTTTSTEASFVSTTTRTTTRPSRLNIFSTQRTPLKITAATSRTTFSSTTAIPEEEYVVSTK